MQEQQPTMSIEQFRQLAGKEASKFSDEQIIELINQLEILAGLYINNLKRAD
jgi:hypothetical protein